MRNLQIHQGNPSQPLVENDHIGNPGQHTKREPSSSTTCVHLDVLDVNAAKPRLLEVYTGNASTNHTVPLHIRMDAPSP